MQCGYARTLLNPALKDPANVTCPLGALGTLLNQTDEHPYVRRLNA